jgi:hypothetical protein
VSTACAQASDGLAQLGSQASVISYLKYIKQSEATDRKERMTTYPDVARIIQIAWEFGPNGSISLEQLKRKLVILLMVDTAARPSDLWWLYATTEGKYRQIEFIGDSDVRIRYFWPKEVDPFSSRTNATNTWFSQWVVIKGTGFEQAVGDLAPESSRTVAVKPTGETGLSIAFDKDGQRVTHGPAGYFEASGLYKVTATIRPDGSVTVTDDL